LFPNEMFAALVTAAGYVPLPMVGEGYLDLLSVTGDGSAPTESTSIWVIVGACSPTARPSATSEPTAWACGPINGESTVALCCGSVDPRRGPHRELVE
jgi:hypothetical protein